MNHVAMPCLRIYTSDTRRLGRGPLYEKVVTKTRELGIAGVTVTRGVMGYGRSRRMRTMKILARFYHMPAVIEVVDTEDRILSFLDHLKPINPDALFTLHTVDLVSREALP